MTKSFAVALSLSFLPFAALAASDPLPSAFNQAASRAKHAEISHHLSRAIALRQQIRETLFAYGKRLDRQVVGEIHGSYSSYISGSFFLLAGSVSGSGEGHIDGSISQLTMQGGEFFSLLIQGDTLAKFLNDRALDAVDRSYPLQCVNRIQDARAELAKVMPWSKALELSDRIKQFRSELTWLEPAVAQDSASANQRVAFGDLHTWAEGTKIYPRGIFVTGYDIVKYHETDQKGKWINQLSYVHFHDEDRGMFDYLIGREIALPNRHVPTDNCNKGKEILDYITFISGFSGDTIDGLLRVY